MVHRLWLRDLRVHELLELEFGDGLTVIEGPNGAGKSSVLEAVHYLGTLSSFRQAGTEAMIRRGADEAIIRAEVQADQRQVLVEAALARVGRDRVLVNKQPLRRTRDLQGVVRTTVFSPDDLILVKGGPGERRAWLDEALGAVQPRHSGLLDEVERTLRQRAALLRQCGGRLDGDAELTLDVWDAKLAAAGTRLAEARIDALTDLGPWLAESVREIASAELSVGATYAASWMEHGLASALIAARRDDLRRGVTTVGPHRDDVVLMMSGRAARTEASQGEQRTLALALRLAAHRWVAERSGEVPVLLLDDVFSELDPQRCAALLSLLPPGQALLATASPVPPGAVVERRIVLSSALSPPAEARSPALTGTSERAVDIPVETVDNQTVGRCGLG